MLLGGLGLPAYAVGSPPASGSTTPPALPEPAAEQAEEVLATAQELVDGPPPAPPGSPETDPTLALAELADVVDQLDGEDRTQAEALLARPGDADGDPIFAYEDGARVRAQCTENFCVHYATRGRDRPSDRDADGDRVYDWVERTGRVLEDVWRAEVGELGYRGPRSDGRKGNPVTETRRGLVDVYLGDIGSQGYFGYAVTDAGTDHAYLVLDEDFDDDALVSQVGPQGLLKITAAHEFFHGVQFRYSLFEEPWFMEGTATWMEDEVYDGINDNRIFLASSAMTAPERSLDTADGFSPYGNWVFFRHVTERFDPKIVRNMWWRAGRNHRDRCANPSTRAINRALRSRGTSFADAFTRFAAANTAPGRHYEEGRHYPVAPMAERFTLGPQGRSTGRLDARIAHLASRSYRMRPGPETRRGMRLRIDVDGPASGARARVLVHRQDGTIRRRTVHLDRSGDGRLRVAFSRATTRRVTVTLANGSITYGCDRPRRSTPTPDRRPFELVARVVR